MSELKVEVITPNGIVFTDKASSCTAPGVEGQFQVLKDHADLLAVLDVGELCIKTNAGEISLATSGGYMEVNKNSINIVVESAELAEAIDIERAKDAEKRAKKRLEQKGDIDVVRAKLALARALNRIKIASQS
jgi:F-type H+-transporting ATPase subunit epsilon